MNGRSRAGATRAAGPRRLAAATAATALVVLWASGAEAVPGPTADTPRAPGVEATDGAAATAAVTGFPTVRRGHARGTMLAV